MAIPARPKRYKLYLEDSSIPTPYRTIRNREKRHNELLRLVEEEECRRIFDSQSRNNENISISNTVQINNDVQQQRITTTNEYFVDEINIEDFDQINEREIDEELDDEDDQTFDKSNLSRYELCYGYLTMFFKGNKTQTCLKDDIDFENFRSNTSIKIPNTVEKLASELKLNDDDDIKSIKKHYCGNCKKLVDLTNRYQRSCATCHNKYN
jgi:hypothetical protein